MEAMGLSSQFWRGKRVLLTGHTGFKGRDRKSVV